MSPPRSPVRVVGINFDHMHMGDNLAMAARHPRVEVIGLWDHDPQRVEPVRRKLNLPESVRFEDWRACLETARPDLVLLCPATAAHAEWVERIAGSGLVAPGGAILLEKPFAANLDQAARIVRAVEAAGLRLAINWPLAWVPAHITAKRLIDRGVIGALREVHYYDGNRGPLWHTAGKAEIDAATVAAQKPTSWFYRADHGGGSLLDYLGYGATLSAWFLNGADPLEVVAMTDRPEGLEVDEQSVTIARYAPPLGLSTFQTRWGTFTDPWTHQPQPMCGFTLVGTDGTISSPDYAPTLRVQTRDHPEGYDHPVETIEPPHRDPVEYVIHCLDTDAPIEGPLSVVTSWQGQRLVDAAQRSARTGRIEPLPGPSRP
ncbi:oxidoreductase domain protein [Isosphaera pallida ATCC 43644]|uniref:Oxidoreductase domain protein n=2 Tax=Isosphaera pallida TaxID=128 RepID=E8R6B4_ISOPI|nr:oxidoreductase domain protein [Isosphaera pallida ATCC 43644]